MSVQVIMPSLSPAMTEGVIVAWRKSPGDFVKKGEVLFEVETDKAVVEVEAEAEGFLKDVVAAEGACVPVNAVIAQLSDVARDSVDVAAPEPTPSSVQIAVPDEPVFNVAGAPIPGEPERAAPSATPSISPARAPNRATPAARHVGNELGVDLAKVRGSGAGGQILRADVVRHAERVQDRVPSNAPISSNKSQSAAAALDVRSLSVPTFVVSVECRAEALMDAKRQFNELKPDQRITLNDLLVRIAAIALRRVPELNACWQADRAHASESIGVSVAIAVDGGVVMPVIMDADRKDLGLIASEIRDLREKARGGKLETKAYANGTFSLSNLGMHRVSRMTAALNSPQAAILAIGSVETRPAVVDGGVAAVDMLTCTLTCDQRVVTGVAAAVFLNQVRAMIEDPRRMLL